MAHQAPPPPQPPLAAADSQKLRHLLFSGKYVTWMCLHVLLLLIHSAGIATSQSLVETLPGYPGKLPFKLETGYVPVGETDDVQLFYYFIESQRNPVRDPLVLWLTGGPGCSALSGLLFEVGPITFDYDTFNGSLPQLKLNPYAWTQVANIIFLDAPVGTGFSYSKTSGGYYTSDTESADDSYNFLRKWLVDHPRFLNNPLYIAGDSYSGIIVPMIVLEISNGNILRSAPPMNLQGYALGNPVTDLHRDENSRAHFAHRVTLISTELYESMKSSCDNEFVYANQTNTDCIDDLQVYRECTVQVNDAHILEPKCGFDSPKSDEIFWDRSFIENISIDSLPSKYERPELWCRNDNYVLSYMWANDQTVQEALHVRNGTITDWKRCNKSLSYDYDIPSVVDYHRNLTKRGFRVLIYSGDHDMLIPYVGTKAWVDSLNVTLVDPWRPWFVDGQVVGYTEKYEDDEVGFRMTFATVKGAGHTAPEYKPKQCLEMIDRWFADYII